MYSQLITRLKRSSESAFRSLVCGVLFCMLLTQCEEILLNDYQDTPKEVFRSCWEFYDIHYPYFELKRVDWDSVYNVYDDLITDDMSDEDLGIALSEMIFSLRDYHAYLLGDAERSFLDKSYIGRRLSQYDLDNNLDFFLTFYEAVRFNEIFTTYSSESNNYLYLPIESFDFEDHLFDKFDEVMGLAQEKEGLIIDVRNNGGGSIPGIEKIASYFTTENYIYAYRRFRINTNRDDFSARVPMEIQGVSADKYFSKPVVLIISQVSGSATESLAAIMKEFPQVVLIGDTTFGGSGGVLEYLLPNGWVCYTSMRQNILADGSFIEANGITPDITNVFRPEENNLPFENEDAAILRAIEILDEMQ